MGRGKDISSGRETPQEMGELEMEGLFHAGPTMCTEGRCKNESTWLLRRDARKEDDPGHELI
jgi:hypothetical protein